MMAYLQTYVLYILGGVIVLLLILLGVQTVRLKLAEGEKNTAVANLSVKEAQLKAQVAVVQQLVQNGEVLSASITEAQNQAARDKKRLADELERIRGQKAPLDCAGASEWAKEKAGVLSGRW